MEYKWSCNIVSPTSEINKALKSVLGEHFLDITDKAIKEEKQNKHGNLVLEIKLENMRC